jgi:hypothetical protein
MNAGLSESASDLLSQRLEDLLNESRKRLSNGSVRLSISWPKHSENESSYLERVALAGGHWPGCGALAWKP